MHAQLPGAVASSFPTLRALRRVHLAVPPTKPAVGFRQNQDSVYTMLRLVGIGSGQRQFIAVTCIAEHA